VGAQKAVVFENRNGLRLFGILHTPPSGAAGDLGVILLSPGVKMRVGPEGLYRRLTEALLEYGLPVLRFDFYGLGDSEGTLHESFLKDVYNHIEVGRFVNDTLDSMDWMQRECGTKRFILSGLCGGAITGLLAGSRDARVAGLLALGMTAVLANRSADPSLYMSRGELAHMRRGYVRKLMDPASWVRLLTLKTDYRTLWRAVFKPLVTKGTPQQASAPAEHDNANPLFPPAFFNMVEGRRPMLFVFGGSDRLRWDFEEKFLARFPARVAAARERDAFDVRVIEHANHVLSFEEWQNEMLAVAGKWLEQRFSASRSPGQPEALIAGNTV
jgi:hypothetical protein